MIHVVTRNRAPQYAAQFNDMYELLHRVYAGNRNWNVDSEEGSLRDHGDPSLSIYLMRLRDDRALSAAVRLSPSEFRQSSSPQAYDRALHALPSGPDIWDASQFCLRDAPDKKRALADMMLGMLEFSLTWGIGTLCFLVDKDLLAAARLLPLPIDFASAAVDVYGEPFVPAALRISPEALQAMRTLTNIESPQLKLLQGGGYAPSSSPAALQA